MISLVDLKRQFQSIKDDILKEIEGVIDGGQYILGPKVKELEEKIAQKLGVKEAVAVGNGTDALVLTLDALGIKSGDEVITTPFTFFASAEAISRIGATPVFVDVDPVTYNIDPKKIEEAITSSTKAIIPVHIFGQPAEMDDIMEIAKKHQLYVIEDACQAFGSSYKGRRTGSLGDVACFSFFPTKNLGTLGDGGIITTSNEQLAARIRKLRMHGTSKKYYHDSIGYNSRLDEIHAAILLIVLDKIDGWNEKRREHAAYYRSHLAHHPLFTPPQESDHLTHIYHLFCLGSTKRKEIMEKLAEHDIQSGVYYPQCLHLQEVYADLSYKKGDFPVSERLSETLFAIPLDPFITKEEQDEVIGVLLSVKEV
ncbi:DegT/DnrJ/EryC1/StrS family aminotransferase [Priestia koreensis]|uniref:DegT/DnrJ/EryC1/StrS family aminotransferase n=1 Tax=Priestia koreensis TaxID=284581 RepID=UPI00203F0634|nr:DegT/DnrJ/EryC1/StrS family aminotransferase [Priestia koreensis]MCM3005479.1 DegT/DnrJ/EryC1/StrS family aminotransferase [Priestia koreensis]